MKIILSILLLAGSAWGQVTTNWVKAPDNLRVVCGRLYNIEKSTNWLELRGVCESILTNGIVVRTYPAPRIHYDSMVRIGNMLGSSSRPEGPPVPIIPYDTRLFITNFPPDKAAGYGDQILGRVMKVGVSKLESGEQLQTWDWGRPHIVAIIKTNKPKVSD